MNEAAPHRLNVVGGFYVEDGCCIACGVPAANAPELFAWDESGHCYVSRQPSNATELGQILAAMGSAEVDCIRYRGADRGVVRALCEHGHAEQVDAVADGLPR